ncbi:MAG TPA: SUF system NifU family Fe-S cluster assembly protein [Verrucomicrobiales bacterium]|jgi:nitrogen fixation NifU-like protein|nr:SUF system NifU family Fe-S cluster assembly protein [Verrucomicrobiales bacterium]
MNPLDELYQAVILEHSRRPRNYGPQPVPPAFHAEGVNPSCGDEIEVWVAFKPDGSIEKVSFQGQGCAISQSAASIMTVKTAGRSVDEARSLISGFHDIVSTEAEPDMDHFGELAVFAGVRQFPQRVKCAMLGWRALEQALNRSSEKVTTE